MSSVQSIVLHEYEKTIKVSQWDTVYGSVRPYTATNNCVWYKSSKPHIVYVEEDTGCIHGLQTGSAVITVYSDENHDIQSYCVVTVEQPVPVSNMWLTRSKMTLKVDEYSDDLCAEIFPYNATNKNVNFTSSNPTVAKVYFNGGIKALSPGTATITATTEDGGYTATCKVRVILDEVIITNYQNTTKVKFASSNKEWICINSDMIYDDNNMSSSILRNRVEANYYVHQKPEPPYTRNETPKEYTDEEIKLLYALDPHGVSVYVKDYALTKNGLSGCLNYKDHIFETLVGRKPNYFARTLSGEWYKTNDKSNLSTVVSESEALFGFHPLYDCVTLYEFIGLLIDIGGVIFTGGLFGTSSIAKAIETVGKTVVTVLSAGDSFISNEIKSYAVGTTVSYSMDFDEELKNTNLSWPLDLINMFGSLNEFMNSITEKPNFLPTIIDYCACKSAYQVFIKSSTGAKTSLESICLH